MTTYIFRDINTGETFDIHCHYSEIGLKEKTNKSLSDWLRGRTVERLEV